MYLKINSLIIFISIIVIIIGGILIANILGLYSTYRNSEPRKTLKGEYDISDIRGSHTLSEISKFYKIGVDTVIQAFGLPENTNSKTFKIKDFKEVFKPVEINGKEYQFETEGFRVFVSLYLGKKYLPSEEVYLPEKTINYLIAHKKLSEEQISYWKKHQFKPEYYSEKATKIDNEDDQLLLTGKTTIKELLKMGITNEEFRDITGFEVPEDTNIVLKDFLTEKGVSFKDIKDKFEEILKKK